MAGCDNRPHVLSIQFLAASQSLGGRLLEKQVVAEIHGIHCVPIVVGILGADEQNISQLTGSEEGLIRVKFLNCSGLAQTGQRGRLARIAVRHGYELVAIRHGGGDAPVSSAPGATAQDGDA